MMEFVAISTEVLKSDLQTLGAEKLGNKIKVFSGEFKMALKEAQKNPKLVNVEALNLKTDHFWKLVFPVDCIAETGESISTPLSNLNNEAEATQEPKKEGVPLLDEAESNNVIEGIAATLGLGITESFIMSYTIEQPVKGAQEPKLGQRIPMVQGDAERHTDGSHTHHDSQMAVEEGRLAVVEKPVVEEYALEFPRIQGGKDPFERKQFMRQLVEKAALTLENNRSELEVQVKPESLGKIMLKVSMEDGNFTGRIYIESQHVKDFIQGNLDELKTLLKEQGYAFSELDISHENHYQSFDFASQKGYRAFSAITINTKTNEQIISKTEKEPVIKIKEGQKVVNEQKTHGIDQEPISVSKTRSAIIDVMQSRSRIRQANVMLGNLEQGKETVKENDTKVGTKNLTELTSDDAIKDDKINSLPKDLKEYRVQEPKLGQRIPTVQGDVERHTDGSHTHHDSQMAVEEGRLAVVEKPVVEEYTLQFPRIQGGKDPFERKQFMRQLVEKAALTLENNRSELEVQVKPESLGKIMLKVSMEDGNFTGRIYTESQYVKDFIQGNLEELKTLLEEQGYVFSELNVDVGDQRESRNNTYAQHFAEKQKRVEVEMDANEFADKVQAQRLTVDGTVTREFDCFA